MPVPNPSSPHGEAAESPARLALAEALAEAGLRALPARELRDLATLLEPVLITRVGARLVEGLDPGQVADFELLTAVDDEVASLDWLKREVPHFRDVVAEETGDLVRATAARVRAALLPAHSDPSPPRAPQRKEAP